MIFDFKIGGADDTMDGGRCTHCVRATIEAGNYLIFKP